MKILDYYYYYFFFDDSKNNSTSTIPANRRASRKQAVQLGPVFVFNNQKFNFSGKTQKQITDENYALFSLTVNIFFFFFIRVS